MLPLFNIDLLILTPESLRSVPKIEVLDIFDGVSKNFHPRGLFSVENFGRVGEVKRNRMFGYMDLNTEILHPLLFKVISELKSLYSDVMLSKEYAIFDTKTKDFIKSDPINGKTGYSFFLSHLNDLKIEERTSDKRATYIEVLNKYRKINKCFMDRLVVLPAGHRDYVIDESGKPSEDEINSFYRGVLGTSTSLLGVNKAANPEYLDSMRVNLQLKVVQIYDYILDMFDGKSKFGQSKFATRKVFDSTRNVITSAIPRNTHLLSKRRTSVNQTRVGLYQYLVANFPIASRKVRDSFLSNVFTGPTTPAVLVNQKTLKKELVTNIEEEYDAWMTMDGFEKTLQVYGEEEYRHDPVMIKDHHAGLIYRDDKTFMIIQDIDELPQELDKKKVAPMTYSELLYIAVGLDAHKTPASVTRYPVAEQGSAYFSYCYLMTTSESSELILRDASGALTNDIYAEFPIKDSAFFNSMSPSPTHLSTLNADFDGDMTNLICPFTVESIDEISLALKSASYYKNARGGMAYSSNDDISSLLFAHLFN